MFACKITCRATVFIKYETGEPTLESTKALFHQQFNRKDKLVSVKKIHEYKYWKNDYGEVAAIIEVDVLVRHDGYVDHLADYEMRACRIVRERFFTGGTAIQVLYTKQYQPLRAKAFH